MFKEEKGRFFVHTCPGRGPAVAAGDAELTVVAGEL